MELLNLKPVGAFIEYTLKPLIDYSRELLEELDKHGIKLKDVLPLAVRIYIIDSIIRMVTAIAVTGMICYTALRFLHTKA